MRTARDYVAHDMYWKVPDPRRLKIEIDHILRRRIYNFRWLKGGLGE